MHGEQTGAGQRVQPGQRAGELADVPHVQLHEPGPEVAHTRSSRVSTSASARARVSGWSRHCRCDSSSSGTGRPGTSEPPPTDRRCRSATAAAPRRRPRSPSRPAAGAPSHAAAAARRRISEEPAEAAAPSARHRRTRRPVGLRPARPAGPARGFASTPLQPGSARTASRPSGPQPHLDHASRRAPARWHPRAARGRAECRAHRVAKRVEGRGDPLLPPGPRATARDSRASMSATAARRWRSAPGRAQLVGGLPSSAGPAARSAAHPGP